jgi:hypothetical protein
MVRSIISLIFQGVLGLAYAAISHTKQPKTVIDSLISFNNLSNTFSICMGQEDGAFIIGTPSAEYYTSPIQYTPITNETYYIIALNQIVLFFSVITFTQDIGTTQISIPTSVQTIIDSGTTNLILPTSIFEDFKSALLSTCQERYSIFSNNNVEAKYTFVRIPERIHYFLWRLCQF